MQNNYKVYMPIFPNNKVYIGITKRKLNERWMNGYGYCHQNRVYSAIKKYGWQNVRHVILYDNLSYLEACEKEISDIELYKSREREFGYNNSIGGGKSALGFKHTKEAKEKIKENNSKYWLGKKRDKATIEKMKMASKGNTNRRGKKNSAHATELNRKKHSIPVLQILGETIIKKYPSAKEAELDLNIGKGDITKVIKGKRKTAGGYNWKYAINKEWADVQGK